MLEKITYRNHLGEELKFGEGGLYLNCNDLHSYKWKYSSNNNKISRFTQDIKERKLPIVVICDTREAGNELMNQMMELAEKDVLTKEAGRILAGDYYLSCFIYGNEKSKYDLRLGAFYATLYTVTDRPFWTKEIEQTFDADSGGSGQNLDYPFDFPYDFASPSASNELINYGFAESDFKMIIYGEVTDPTLSINGHEYEVTGHVNAGEYLEIDSKEKTITLVQVGGNRVNWFSHRNKESYIFEKIPSGASPVLWSGDFIFSVTLFEERSEPKWT